MKKPSGVSGVKASELITRYIAGLGDWRGVTLATLREIILAATPGLTETTKWGAPVWESDGLICVAGAFKGHVKLTFSRGASLPDPKRLFNASLEGKRWRAIDFREGDAIDAAGLKALVKAAAALNAAATRK